MGGAAAPGAGPSGRWPRLPAGAEQGGGATSRLSAMQPAGQKSGSGVPPLARPSAGQQQQEGVLPQELATDGSLPSLPRSPGEGLAHLQLTARMHRMRALPSTQAGSGLSGPSPRVCCPVPRNIFSSSKLHLCNRQDTVSWSRMEHMKHPICIVVIKSVTTCDQTGVAGCLKIAVALLAL